jgi:hypothetical protein
MELSLLAPLIVAFVQLFKEVGVPSKFSPVVALAIGLLLAWFFNHDPLQGIIAAFTSMGLWSGGKATIETIRDVNK